MAKTKVKVIALCNQKGGVTNVKQNIMQSPPLKTQ